MLGRLQSLFFLSFLAASWLVLLQPAKAAGIQDGNVNITDGFTDEEKKALGETKESYSFQAEVSRLMDIIINSLYTQKEVFLRELISNAADALEKARFLSVTDSKFLETNPDLEIRVAVDSDAKTITIQDSGVGMTKNDLVNNLGTVARSGTTNFLEALAQGAELNLIGQFGVGFYSAFLVADRVSVTSKSNESPTQYIWESTVDNSFTVAADPRGNTLGRGTRITLHLKDDSMDFLDVEKIKNAIMKFNQFVSFPIFLRTEKPSDTKKSPEPKKDEKDEEGQEEPSKEDAPIEYIWQRLNDQKALWLRPKEEINSTEYIEFYKAFAKDTEPLAYTHFTAEGEVEFKSILYIPGHAPHDAWSAYFTAKQDSIKLYARRVLVADSVYELLPKWLNFIKGVVDSDDLPLKVDRESLSQTRVMNLISKKLVGKFVELLRKLSKDDRDEWEKYSQAKESNGNETAAPKTKFGQFWKHFSKNMRVGCVEDDTNRNKLVKLFRFHTSITGLNESVSLDEYIKRQPEDQKQIYYIASDNYEAALQSPLMQIYKKRGQEVIVLMDPLDEPCFSRLQTYSGKTLISVEKSNAKPEFSDEERSYQKKVDKAFRPLTNLWKERLRGKVAAVRLSHRLVDDPLAIVTDVYGNSAFGDRVMRAQTFSSQQPGSAAWTRYLEINPNHPLIKKLLSLTEDSSDDPQFEQALDTLYETALLNSGFIIDNPAPLSRKMVKLLQADFGIDREAAPEPYELTASEAEDDGTEDLPDDADDDQNGGFGHGSLPPNFDQEEVKRILRERHGLKDEL